MSERVVLAILLLFYGASKLIGGVGFITGMLQKAGLPGMFGYRVSTAKWSHRC